MLRYTLPLAAALFASAADAAYCTAGPTDGQDSNMEEMTFTDASGVAVTVNKADLSTNPGGCPAPTSNIEVDIPAFVVNPGGTYTLSVTAGTCRFVYPGGVQAWIDFNDDQQFGDEESLGSAAGVESGSVQTWEFTVPADAVNGPSRMRIMQQESVAPPLNSCGTYNWGSMWDFDVTIGGGGGGSGGSGAGDDGLSGGSILLIILVVLIPLYIGLGCYYNRSQKGTTGMVESCPQHEMWLLIPGLVKDGISFSIFKTKQMIARCQGGSSGGSVDGYDEL